MDLYRSWAEIDLQAFDHNLQTLRHSLATGTKVVAVLKANAYGHGLEKTASALDSKVEAFGVANLGEALAIKQAGALKTVLILSPALPSERQSIVLHQFIPTISTAEEAAGYAQFVSGNVPLPIYFVVDTGMGRVGLWREEAAAELARIRKIREISILAFSSHLPVSDEDPAYTRQQLAEFERQARALFPSGVPLTILNSAGILGWPENTRTGDLVRVGLALYGISPLAELQEHLRPALSWKTRVTLVRSLGPGRSVSYGRTFISQRAMRVATLAVGYGDGYQRHLSGQGTQVLVGGVRCALLGRVTMDQIIVDVSHAGPVKVGDEVVLIGTQGAERILASELAAKAGTIAWEVFTGITERVVRVYY
jgi:alanine racemase